MQKYLFALACCITLLLSSCQDDNSSKTTTKEPDNITSGSAQSLGAQCVLSKESLLGVKVGEPIEDVEKRSNGGLVKEKVVTGEGEFEAFKFTALNKQTIRIYPMMKNGKNVVHRMEYMGSGCETDKGIKVSSTLSALLAAYPDLVVHGSEIEGVTTATGGGWMFLLGDNHFEYNVDIKKLNPDIRVTAIVMQ